MGMGIDIRFIVFENKSERYLNLGVDVTTQLLYAECVSDELTPSAERR